MEPGHAERQLRNGRPPADQVTAEGWRLFHERLGIAEKALKHAWSLDDADPEIPTLMITVVLGQESGRAEMEKWFARAMKADPNCYDACRAKLHFLLPQWYGSGEDMVAFGRECVANTNWGGSVPLILVDAHSDFDRTLRGQDRADYWARPEVWPDIKAGYERYALVNPDKTRFRYPYAWYAYSCGQMEDFKEQIKLIRQNDHEVHYGYFGGKEAFDNLMATAEGRAVQTNAPAMQ